MRLIRSGNFLLKVYRGGDESDLVITRRFLVADRKVLVDANLGQSYAASQRQKLQRINFNVMLTGLQVFNPVTDIQVVVLQNGRLYIRGGRTEEVGFYLEGASTRNVLDGSNITTVIPEALEEFQIQAGGYNAQYGGANSGIVRQTLRSGTSNLKASLLTETDNFTSQYKKSLGTYSYGYSDYVATLSGSLLTENIKFFVAGENRFGHPAFRRDGA